MKLSRHLLTLFVSSLPLWASASPPLDSSRNKVTQPDGVSFLVSKRGDAWFNWQETRDGHVIIKDKKSGYYHYAIIDNAKGQAKLVSSGVKVNPTMHSKNSVNHDNKEVKMLTAKDLMPLRKAALKRKKLLDKQPMGKPNMFKSSKDN